MIAYIDLDEPVIHQHTSNSGDPADPHHQVLQVTASPSLRRLIDELADEVIQS